MIEYIVHMELCTRYIGADTLFDYTKTIFPLIFENRLWCNHVNTKNKLTCHQITLILIVEKLNCCETNTVLRHMIQMDFPKDYIHYKYCWSVRLFIVSNFIYIFIEKIVPDVFIGTVYVCICIMYEIPTLRSFITIFLIR